MKSVAIREEGVQAGWAIIKAFAEVTQNQNAVFVNILKNIVEKAYLLFESQPYRRFVIALRFHQEGRQTDVEFDFRRQIWRHFNRPVRLPGHERNHSRYGHLLLELW